MGGAQALASWVFLTQSHPRRIKSFAGSEPLVQETRGRDSTCPDPEEIDTCVATIFPRGVRSPCNHYAHAVRRLNGRNTNDVEGCLSICVVHFAVVPGASTSGLGIGDPPAIR